MTERLWHIERVSADNSSKGDTAGRNQWIDFCKGILIILVIVGHFCAKFIVCDDTQLIVCNSILYFIYSFHMPAFFIISGYVFRLYTASKIQAETFWKFAIDKLIGYGIPYVVFSVIYGAMKLVGKNYSINPINNASVLLFPIKPLGYLWFLYALFVFTILAYIIEKKKINRYIYVGIFAVLFVLSKYIHISWLGLFRVCRFGIFFALGNGFASEIVKDFRPKKKILFLITTVFFVLEIYYIYLLLKNGVLSLKFDEEPKYLILWFFLSFLGSYILVNICQNMGGISKKNWIVYAGKNSIILYLMHQIVISVLRAVLIHLNITSTLIQILFTFCGSILCCILVSKMAERFRVIGFVFFPKKYLKK